MTPYVGFLTCMSLIDEGGERREGGRDALCVWCCVVLYDVILNLSQSLTLVDAKKLNSKTTY